MDKEKGILPMSGMGCLVFVGMLRVQRTGEAASPSTFPFDFNPPAPEERTVMVALGCEKWLIVQALKAFSAVSSSHYLLSFITRQNPD